MITTRKILNSFGVSLIFFCQASFTLGHDETLLAQEVTQDSVEPVRKPSKLNQKKLDASILNQIADRIEADYNHLQTLSGYILVQDTTRMDKESLSQFLEGQKSSINVIPEWGYRKTRATVQFAWDFRQSYLFTEYQVQSVTITDPDGVSRPVQGLQVGDTPIERSFWERTVINNDGYIHFQPNVKYSDIEGIVTPTPIYGRVAFKESPDLARRQSWGTVISPASFFHVGRPLWEEFRLLASTESFIASEDFKNLSSNEQAQVKKALQLREIENGAKLLVTFTGIKNGQSDVKIIQQWILNINDDDYSLAALQIDESKENHTRTKQFIVWEWEQDGEFRIPKSINRLWTTPDGQSVQTERGMTLRVDQVNEPIPASQFSLAALQLADGDRLSDRINRTCYVIKNGELADPISFDFEPTLASLDSSETTEKPMLSQWMKVIILVNIVLLGSLLLWYLSRRFRAKQ